MSKKKFHWALSGLNFFSPNALFSYGTRVNFIKLLFSKDEFYLVFSTTYFKNNNNTFGSVHSHASQHCYVWQRKKSPHQKAVQRSCVPLSDKPNHCLGIVSLGSKLNSSQVKQIPPFFYALWKMSDVRASLLRLFKSFPGLFSKLLSNDKIIMGWDWAES